MSERVAEKLLREQALVIMDDGAEYAGRWQERFGREAVEAMLIRALEHHGTALVNLTGYISDLQDAVADLMTALGNAYHPAHGKGREVLKRGGK